MRQPLDSITEFIFMEDELKSADIILIPGGSHRELMEHAAKLYHKGLAPYILPSGSYNKKIPEYNSEWQFLHDIAIELGIPEESILKEDKAAHTFQNAEFSYEVIKKEGLNVNKAILVCKAFHSRRAYLTYKTNFPSSVQFIVSPMVDSKNIAKDNWFLDSDKTNKVMGEVIKIGKYFESHVPHLVNK